MGRTRPAKHEPDSFIFFCVFQRFISQLFGCKGKGKNSKRRTPRAYLRALVKRFFIVKKEKTGPAETTFSLPCVLLFFEEVFFRFSAVICFP
jgi:hypothetical protein